MDVKETEVEPGVGETLSKAIDLLKRRGVGIIAVACLITIATNAVLAWLPNRYTSQATLLVVQQQVPERYVVPTTSTSLADALQAMKEEVLSRTRLSEIIGDFDLYAKERTALPPEQIIDLMRRNIDIQPLNADPERRDFNAFRISFTATSPHLAQDVTSRLTSLFIQANLKTREDQAKNTTRFLSEQLKVVANRLVEQEQRLRDYKMQHLGELPEQEQGNVAILGGLQAQLQNTEASLSRAQQQRVYLESLLDDYRRGSAHGALLGNGLSGTHIVTPLAAATAELTRLQTVRDNLLSRYTSAHPDVKKAEADVVRQSQVVDRLRTSESAQSNSNTPQTPINSEDDISTIQIRSQLEANRVEIDGLLGDQKRLKAAAADYQHRLDATPVTEQQLAEVLRDYDLLKKEYADLLSKQEQSQLASSLEKQQEGQQFRLVDLPSLPTVPSSPKRLKMSLGGIAGGLFVGLAFALLREMRKQPFHDEKELKKCFSVPVVSVPLVLTPREKRNRTWRNSFEWTTASALFLAALAAEFLVYRWR
ncbi:MAG TPA: GNVR domain-containing protein [Bryobacteraceae bacterium]|nr:GNVR domain-containing protein [Bryobacteraceae bacterium]